MHLESLEGRQFKEGFIWHLLSYPRNPINHQIRTNH